MHMKCIKTKKRRVRKSQFERNQLRKYDVNLSLYYNKDLHKKSKLIRKRSYVKRE